MSSEFLLLEHYEDYMRHVGKDSQQKLTNALVLRFCKSHLRLRRFCFLIESMISFCY